MTFKFYTISDDRKAVKKTITSSTLVKTVTGYLKGDCDILHPVLELAYDGDLLAANYLYIQEFGRYYFIGPPKLSQQRLYITGEIDALMSWKDDIMDLSCVLSRQEKLFNLYLNDGNFHLLQKKQISSIVFPQSFTTDGSYILAVGGSS